MMNEQEIYRKAVELWGAGFQMDMAIEECSELIHAVCKLRRGQGSEMKVMEEVVDVCIMMEQMKYIFDRDGSLFQKIHAERMDRLESIIKGTKP
jgi:hypothetical protein